MVSREEGSGRSDSAQFPIPYPALFYLCQCSWAQAGL